jgi:Tol biopolymer transport system component
MAACGAANAPKATTPATSVLAFRTGCELWLVGDDWDPRRFKQQGWGPDWSPDGTRLAFLTKRGLVVHDVTKRVDHVVLKSSVPELADCTQTADWAPRGDRIGFLFQESASSCRTPTLATINSAGGPPIGIANTPVCEEDIPFAWSPDGRELVYATCDIVGPGGHGERDCTLFRVGADGAGKRRLLKHLSFAGLAWSPDGSAIALLTQMRRGSREGDAIEGSAGLYVLELRSGTMRRVVRGGGGGPGSVRSFGWSPDSAWLAYTRWVEPPGATGISLVSRNGNQHRTLLKPAEVEYGELAWSLDRNLIAAEASTPNTDSSGSELHVIDATQGVVLHRVRVAGGFVSSMAWRAG